MLGVDESKRRIALFVDTTSCAVETKYFVTDSDETARDIILARRLRRAGDNARFDFLIDDKNNGRIWRAGEARFSADAMYCTSVAVPDKLP